MPMVMELLPLPRLFKMMLMAFAFPISMKPLNSGKLDSGRKSLFLGVSDIEAVALAKRIRHHLDGGWIGVDSSTLR